MVNEDPDVSGTLCLAPEGRSGAFGYSIMKLDANGVRQCEMHPGMDIREWFKFVVGASKFMVAPLVFRRHALFKNDSDPAGVPAVAINFETVAFPCGSSFSQFPRHENAEPARQFLSHKGEYVLAQGRNQHRLVYFSDAHERLVPLGTFILIARPAVNQFGISCSKAWLKGSLRYPEDAEPDEDEHQYHAYVSVRVKTRTGDLIVRVVHAHVESCRIMEGSGITSADVSLEASPSPVQFNNHAGLP